MERRVPRFSVIAPGGGRLMTKQAMAAETDVNAIVARHIAHGVPFPVGSRATYGDFSNSMDFHSSLNAVMAAEAEFLRLPSAVRDFCENDPGKFLDLVSDPGRRDDLVKLGLVPEMVPAPVDGPGALEGARAPAPSAGDGSAPGAVPG